MYNKFKIKIKEPLFSKFFEEYKDKNNEEESDKEKRGNLFPKEVIEKMPDKKIKNTCREINFSYSHEKPIACILLLRRLLPLSIIKKFLMEDEEEEVFNEDEKEYYGTQKLLNKSEHIIKKRTYNEVKNNKILLDSSQHLFCVDITMDDAERIGNKIRVFLEDLFEN